MFIMETTIIYENGDAFEITYKRAVSKEQNKTYFYIDNVLCEVINKIKTNTINVNDRNRDIYNSLQGK